MNRDAPGVRIAWAADERAASEPLDLAGRVLGLVFEESEAKSSKATLELDNSDLALFDRPELAGGAVLEVSWGYRGAMTPPARVVVRKLRGFQTLTLECHALSALLHREARTRAWTFTTVSAVVEQLAAQHGYAPPFTEIDATDDLLDVVSQAGETDAQFLRRLAGGHGFTFGIEGRTLRWGRARRAGEAPILTWFGDRGRGDVISVRLESDHAARVGRVEVRGRDPLLKSTIRASASSAHADGAAGRDELEVLDPETGASSIKQRDTAVTVHSSAAATPMSAGREAARRSDAAARQAVRLAVQVVGDPQLGAKQLVEMRGISALLSGRYVVADAKHAVSSGGYVTDLSLRREGTAECASSSSTQQTPTAGRASAAGVDEDIELIDPELGTSRMGRRAGASP